MKNIILLLTVVFLSLTGFSQEGREQASAQLKKLSENYKSIPFLSFDMHYLYADEKTPTVYADSLEGTFHLNGSRFYYSIANTRMIFNGERAIAFYNDDSVIYLSKPSPAMMNNPLAMLDSLFNRQDMDFSIKDLKDNIVINIKSKDSSQFKEINYEISKASGLVDKLTQVVNAKFMYDQGEKNSEKGNNSYAVVITRFSNYSKNKFDTSVFDIDKYVKVVDGRYVPIQPYASYQVFNANPNL